MSSVVVRFKEEMTFPHVEDAGKIKWRGGYILDDVTGILEGYIEEDINGIPADEQRRAWILGICKGTRWCFNWFGSKNFDFPITIRFFDGNLSEGILVALGTKDDRNIDMIEVGYSTIQATRISGECTEAKEVIKSIVEDIKESIYLPEFDITTIALNDIDKWAKSYYQQKTGRPW